MTGDHRVSRDDSVEAEDLAELPAALQHELGLTLAEAENLEPLRQVELGRAFQRGEFGFVIWPAGEAG